MPTADPSGYAQLARLIWIMFGPMGLTVLVLVIGNATGSGWRTTADMIYLTLLAVTILARWLEFSTGDARSGTGDPVTRTDVIRYSIVVSTVGLAAWVAANIVANNTF